MALTEASRNQPAARTPSFSHPQFLLLLTLAACAACSFHDVTAAAFDDPSLPCPRGCLCDKALELVSCSNGMWTYIPAIPRFARRVVFENNTLLDINNGTLAGLTVNGAQIHSLSLSGNNISSFARKSFTHLEGLQSILLDRVTRNYSMLQEMFEDLNVLQNLTHLSLSGNKLGKTRTFPENFFQSLANSNLSRLYLRGLHCGMYNHSDFLPLRNLQHLDLGSNHIREVHLATSDTLRVLVLGGNLIVNLPNFCHNTTGPYTYFKNLQVLFLNANLLYRIDGDKFRCMSELQNISLAMNVVKSIKPNTFGGMPKLNDVFLYSMRIAWLNLKKHAFNNSNIKSIHLYNNRIFFEHDVNTKAFHGCRNLQYLDISHNLMNKFSPETFQTMFGSLTKLKMLRMVDCRLHSLPFRDLSFFSNLTRLDMGYNSLTECDGTVFQTLPRIQNLSLSYNQIQTLDATTFGPVLARLDHVDFAGNPFACDCRLLWFKTFITNHSSRVMEYPEGYRCATPLDVKNSNIASLELSARTCLLPPGAPMVIIACCCVVILLTVAVALRWRYRWHLHFLLLVLERRHSRRRPGAFLHDYYVSADMDSHTDREWVLQQLMPRLAQFGLRACSAEDTTPGHPELSSALTAMTEQCQRVLFVVSNDYAQSGRCQFELTLALKASLELQRQDITVILLEPVASRYVSSALQVLVQEFACLPWPSHSADLATARDRFWETLRSALVPRDDTV